MEERGRRPRGVGINCLVALEREAWRFEIQWRSACKNICKARPDNPGKTPNDSDGARVRVTRKPGACDPPGPAQQAAITMAARVEMPFPESSRCDTSAAKTAVWGVTVGAEDLAADSEAPPSNEASSVSVLAGSESRATSRSARSRRCLRVEVLAAAWRCKQKAHMPLRPLARTVPLLSHSTLVDSRIRWSCPSSKQSILFSTLEFLPQSSQCCLVDWLILPIDRLILPTGIPNRSVDLWTSSYLSESSATVRGPRWWGAYSVGACACLADWAPAHAIARS